MFLLAHCSHRRGEVIKGIVIVSSLLLLFEKCCEAFASGHECAVVAVSRCWRTQFNAATQHQYGGVCVCVYMYFMVRTPVFSQWRMLGHEIVQNYWLSLRVVLATNSNYYFYLPIRISSRLPCPAYHSPFTIHHCHAFDFDIFTFLFLKPL